MSGASNKFNKRFLEIMAQPEISRQDVDELALLRLEAEMEALSRSQRQIKSKIMINLTVGIVTILIVFVTLYILLSAL